MTETSSNARPYVIVVGVDPSAPSTLAFEEALRIGAHQPAGEVHALRVREPSTPGARAMNLKVPSHEEVAGEIREQATRMLEELSSKGVDLGALKVIVHTAVGSPAEMIAQLCADLEADLVVVGSHGRTGLERFLLGSVAEGVVRLAPAPVLVARPKVSQYEDLPKIAPPCPACLETRRATQGKEYWCAQHRERHDRRHTYHAVDRNAGSHPNLPLLIPIER